MNHLSILNFNTLVRFFVVLLVVTDLTSLTLQFLVGESNQQNNYVEKMDQYHKIKHKLKVLVLGSSHSKDVHIASLGLVGTNFYESFGDITEALFKFNRIIPELPKIKYVLIPLSPGSLIIDHHVSMSDNTRFLNVLRNSPLFLSDYIRYPIDIISNEISNYFPINDYQSLLKSKLLSLIKNNNYLVQDENCFYEGLPRIKGLIEDGIVGGYHRKLMKPKCIQKYATSTVSRHSKLMIDTLSINPSVVKRNTQRLAEMADMLENRGAHLILFIPPLTREYYSKKALQKILPEHLSVLTRFANHPAVEFYDYHDFFYKELDTGVNDYFYDDDHLALPGAIKFSSMLKEQLLTLANNVEDR